MMAFIEQWGLLGLFISAFISSTLLPGGSEALLIALALEGAHSKPTLLIIATIGNTLGGMTSWLMGRYFSHIFAKNLSSSPNNRNAIKILRQHGKAILLFSWLPIIGDPLCLMAGWVKIHCFSAFIYIATGKFLRYFILIFFI